MLALEGTTMKQKPGILTEKMKLEKSFTMPVGSLPPISSRPDSPKSPLSQTKDSSHSPSHSLSHAAENSIDLTIQGETVGEIRQSKKRDSLMSFLGAEMPCGLTNGEALLMMMRDLEPTDYETLTKLDEKVAPHTTDEEKVHEFKVLKFSEFSNSSSPSTDSKQCAVCLVDFESSDSVKILPCNHAFHKNCIDTWLLKFNHTCPLDSKSY
jgi:Ring finger domain